MLGRPAVKDQIRKTSWNVYADKVFFPSEDACIIPSKERVNISAGCMGMYMSASRTTSYDSHTYCHYVILSYSTANGEAKVPLNESMIDGIRALDPCPAIKALERENLNLDFFCLNDVFTTFFLY